MAKKRRQHNDEAWRAAKKACRLNARQVEMARALGMNPKKLPRLRPSPQQRWKLPVGEFIEECYWKRFGGKARHNAPREPKPTSPTPSTPRPDAHTPEPGRDPTSQAESLVCYFMNLADDLQTWLAQGTIDLEVLSQVEAELRKIADALDTGSSVPQKPAIPVPPRDRYATSPWRNRPAETSFGDAFDDDIPF